MGLPLLVTLGFWATLLADVVGWAVVHAGTGYLAHRLPAHRLEREGWLLRLRPWEGPWYGRLRVRRWKGRLPEAGAVFRGGISKRRLPASLAVFVRETRRAELAHWWALAAGPLFALWNPPAGVVMMIAYGVAVNAPFIIVQRSNRSRAQRVLTRQAHRGSGSAPPTR